MVTVTNSATGVVTTVFSNEAGLYSFASLLPGVYSVKAELPGFQTQRKGCAAVSINCADIKGAALA
jgi:hypothetical protein